MAGSKIEAEIVDLLRVKGQGDREDRRDFLARLVRDKEVDAVWSKFSDEAQAWLNAGTEADNEDKDIEDFSDYQPDEADTGRERGGRDDDRRDDRSRDRGRDDDRSRDDRGGDRDRERSRDDRGGDRDRGRDEPRRDDRGGDRDSRDSRDRGRDEPRRDERDDRSRDDRTSDRDKGRDEPRRDDRDRDRGGDRDRGRDADRSRDTRDSDKDRDGGRDSGGGRERTSSSRGGGDAGTDDAGGGKVTPAVRKAIKEAVFAAPKSTADGILKKLDTKTLPTKEQVAEIRAETLDTLKHLQEGGYLKKKLLT